MSQQKKSKIIYLDHAATTYIDPRVKEAMDPYFEDVYGNPGSLHQIGLRAREVIDKSKETIAKIINCQSKEIIFTSGGTESINLAIKGVAFRKGEGHIITSKIEHPAVLETCHYLEQKGFKVTYLEVDNNGLIDPKELEKAITKETILITIMYANNEIGTVEPIKEIGEIAKKHKIIFHTDACQAAGALDLDVKKINVDLMTLNGSKIYGPKGVGILYKSADVKLEPLIHGGGQEFGLRSGTENVPGIIGFTKALELSQTEKEIENIRLIKLRDYLIKELLEKIPKSFLNGHKTKRLPNNVNISFLDVEGESILLYLDQKGVEISTGSACSSQKLEVSHVLDAIGLIHDAAHGSIRFTLGHRTTKEDLDYTVMVLKEIIENLRRISPIKVRMEDIRNKSVESSSDHH
ncbi:cysteine desulfurase NifS [Candidatus Woesearchaeota archaeon CG_4_10_14_0_2_um_filter_33_13]|nr:MAG: cysteine desulfurase NifS [Candidatus Woesearchaeota archaeon CG_4_10_14_0_2_um_filter_33_13]